MIGSTEAQIKQLNPARSTIKTETAPAMHATEIIEKVIMEKFTL